MKHLIIFLIAVLMGTAALAQEWELQASYSLSSVVFADTMNGWAVGGFDYEGCGGTIVHTVNGGNTWTEQYYGYPTALRDIAFVNPNCGWAVAWCSWTGSSTIVHTTNGGGIWVLQAVLDSMQHYRYAGVDFVDEDSGWIVGGWTSDDTGHYFVVHTIDAGTTWAIQWSDTGQVLNGVDFVDYSNGWAVSGYSVGDVPGMPRFAILHTTDGGDTWTAQISDTGYALSRVTFVDTNHGWATGGTYWNDPQGSTRVILSTTNGGADWTEQMHEAGSQLYGVAFVDTSNGWAVGDDGIFHTTDGGGTWALQYAGTAFGVDFIGTNHGWAVGYNGILHYGSHPRIEVQPQQLNFGGVPVGEEAARLLTVKNTGTAPLTVTEMNTGGSFLPLFGLPLTVAAGDSAQDDVLFMPDTVGIYMDTLVIASNAPAGSLSVRLIGAGVESSWMSGPAKQFPSEYALDQNYPNPFNSSTMITYDLPKAGHILLRVFDLLGREVAVLKEGMMEAGTHRVMFDGSSLASGIHFARLEAGNFSQTRKLMLLK